MPSKRRRLQRLNDSELDAGQLAWILGEEDPPNDIGVMAFNHFCWLERDDPDWPLRDGTPSARDLWQEFGQEAIEAWHRKHGDTPHPLVEILRMP